MKDLEADKIQEVELRRRVQDQAEQLRDKSTEVERLEKLLEQFDSLAQESDGMFYCHVDVNPRFHKSAAVFSIWRSCLLIKISYSLT